MSFKIENVSESIAVDKGKYEGMSRTSVYSVYGNYTQTIVPGENTLLRWWIEDESNSLGDAKVEMQTNDRFVNKSGKRSAYAVDGFMTWNIGATPGSSRAIYIVKNGNVSGSQGRIGYANYLAGSDYPVTSFVGTVVLEPDEYFEVYVLHNDSSSQQVNSQINFPGSRMNIVKLS
jgi:hypothetical protein